MALYVLTEKPIDPEVRKYIDGLGYTDIKIISPYVDLRFLQKTPEVPVLVLPDAVGSYALERVTNPQLRLPQEDNVYATLGVPGPFQKSLQHFGSEGDPIPLVLDHTVASRRRSLRSLQSIYGEIILLWVRI